MGSKRLAQTQQKEIKMTALSKYEFMIKVMNLMSQHNDRDSLFWRWSPKEKEMQFFVVCNDLFYWATADLERITPENLHLLKLSYEDCEKACPVMGTIYATEVFACRVRGMRPQGAAYPCDMTTTHTTGNTETDSLAGVRTLMDAAGPEREIDQSAFGNPYERPEDET